MSSEENFLENAFYLIEEAEQLAENFDYANALKNLQQALILFDKSSVPSEEKQQARDMILNRVEALDNMIRASLPSETSTPQVPKSAHLTPPPETSQKPASLTPPPLTTLNPPPVFGGERDQMIKLGLKALQNSEELINQGYIYRAYKSITYAYSHLSQAQYDPMKVSNIGKIVQFLADNLQAAGYQIDEDNEAYTPSFLTTNQPDYGATPNQAASYRSSKEPDIEPYTPTFLTTDQVNYAIPSNGKNSQSSKQDEYIPTFSQTDQPDFADKTQSRVPISLKHLKADSEYVPTFAQSPQTDVIPVKQQKMHGNQSHDSYTPTFAQTNQEGSTSNLTGEPKVDFAGLKQMFSYIEQDKPIPEEFITNMEENIIDSNREQAIRENSALDQGFKQDQMTGEGTVTSHGEQYISVGSSSALINPKYSGIILEESLQNWNMDLQKITSEEFEELLNEKQHNIELRAQEVLDNFESTQEVQQKKTNAVLEFIDLIHPFEKSYDYESAIKTTYKSINKLNKLHGWADQGLVLYAWLLILKEKQRTFFRYGEGASDFDLGRINQEFVQIMTDSLNTSKEVAISFIGEDFNQELNAHQIYKAKLEDQQELQDKVFDLLDTGNLKLLNEHFAEAIAYYNRAVLSLNSLDWEQLRKSIESLILDISDLQQLHDLSLVREFSAKEIAQLSSVAGNKPSNMDFDNYSKEIKKVILRQFEIRENRIQDLENQIQNQSDQKYKALSLISQGEGLILSDLFDEAIQAYEEAIVLLIDAGWQAQIPKITDRLVKIRRMREEFIHSKQNEYDQMFRRNVERRTFEDSLGHAVKQELVEFEVAGHSDEEVEEKRQDLEKQKDEIFAILSKVEKLAESNQLAEAILALKPVKAILEKQQWDAHLPYIYDFVTMVQEHQNQEKDNIERKELQKKEIEAFKSELEAYLDEEAQKITDLQNRKLKYLTEFQKYIKREQATSDDALNLMEKAEIHLKNNEFQAAIDIYQEAELYFAKLGWNVNIQQQIQRARQKEFEFKHSLTEYEVEAQQKREMQVQKSVKVKKKKKQERSALSDIQNMLSSINQGSTKKDSSPSQERSSPIARRQISSVQDAILKANLAQKQQEKEEKKKSKNQKDSEELDELQRMIRRAAQNDKDSSA